MPPGKLAAQAGHAFVETLHEADTPFRYPGRATVLDAYLDQHPGTKVVLLAPNLPVLLAVYELASDAELPCALITDSGHVLPPHFDGSPVVTALGIGPVKREEVAHLIKRLTPA